MKKILFLLLFPSLALAQYQGNANQKITLGEQTTADGLVWRGIRADTTSKIVPFSDTSAYIILDTVEKTLWLYKAGQTPKWQQVGGSAGGGGTVTSITGGTGLTGGTITSTGTLAADTNFLVTRFDTSSMLTNYYRAGRNTIIQAVDVPTLNQNTTGSAATLTTGRTIQTNLASTSAATFNGSANITPGVTGTLPVANGGTGADMSSLPNNYLIRKNSSGIFDTAALYEANGTIGIGGVASDFSYKVNIFGKLLAKTAGTDNAFTLEATSGTETPNFTFLSTTNRYNMDNAQGNFRIFTENTDGTNGVVRIFVMADGKLGIGITPDEKLHVDGNAKITGLANAANPVNVQVDVNGVLVRTSSIDIKEDVQSLPYGLNEVMLLQPSKFSYIDKYKYGEGYDIGFIAQDVNNIIPEAVGTGIESDIFMDSVKLIPVLTKAIQEQQALIKALEQRIINLENK